MTRSLEESGGFITVFNHTTTWTGEYLELSMDIAGPALSGDGRLDISLEAGVSNTELMITVMDMETSDVIVVLGNDVSFTTSVHTNIDHISWWLHVTIPDLKARQYSHFKICLTMS